MPYHITPEFPRYYKFHILNHSDVVPYICFKKKTETPTMKHIFNIQFSGQWMMMVYKNLDKNDNLPF